MHSQFNENLLVTQDQSVVSLVRIGYHLVIVVESLDNDNGPDEDIHTQWFDFVTKEKPKPRHHHDNHLTQGLSDFSRHCALFYKNIKGFAHNSIVEGIVRDCPKLNSPWLLDNSWPCPADKVQLMIQDIQKDIQTPPRLQYKGGPDSVNCTTWSWEKLEIAGINARKETRHTPVTFVATHNMAIGKNPRPSM